MIDYLNNLTLDACLSCYFALVGVLSSLVTWWADGRPHTFFGWALPNSIINGLFGATFVLILDYYMKNLPKELLFFVAASSGSLGKYALISLLGLIFHKDLHKLEKEKESKK